MSDEKMNEKEFTEFVCEGIKERFGRPMPEDGGIFNSHFKRWDLDTKQAKEEDKTEEIKKLNLIRDKLFKRKL